MRTCSPISSGAHRRSKPTSVSGSRVAAGRKGRTSMLLRPGSVLVFDQILTSANANSFSAARFDDWLGRGADLRLFLVADRVSGSGNVTVSVRETPDAEMDGVRVGEGPWIDQPLSATDVTVLAASVSGLGPSLGLRKLLVGI